MRVFLDIGSHVGETINEVAMPKYRFDRIICFEPASSCLSQLKKLAAADRRIEICAFGLGDRNATLELHNPGTLGASVLASGGPTERVEIIDAADWFRTNLDRSDFIVVKTNCEGAEIAIVNRLLDAGLLGLAVSFLITFDIRDYPELRHEELELRKRLKASALANFCFSDDVMIGTTHEKRIAHWLGLFGIDSGGDRIAVERQFAENFRKYSRKTGRRQRIERAVKERFNYSALPEPLKAALRTIKRALGMSRERDA